MSSGPGVLFDGVAAKSRPVTVGLVAGALTLAETGTDWRAVWPSRELRVVDASRDGLRLRRLNHAARLLLPPGILADAVRQQVLPYQPSRRGSIVLASVAGLMVIGLIWRGGSLITDFAAGLVPASLATKVSDVAIAQLAVGRQCDAPAGQTALEALGSRLAAAGDLPATPRLYVVDHPAVNAFALPDGRVVLLRGLLARADSADAVAGVIAHEFGHVRHDHATRNFMRAAGIAALATLVTGGADLGALAAGVWSLSHTRAFEREADAAALRTLAAAGIDPDGLRRFLGSLEDQETGGGSWLSSHPAPQERIAAIANSEAAGRLQPALPLEQWAALRQICG